MSCVQIKNCGLRRAEEIQQAHATGASFVGFVHHPASPRHLALDAIRTLIAATPSGLHSVVVTVDPPDALVAAITALQPAYLQVHQVTAERLLALKTHTDLPIIAGVGMQAATDMAQATALETAAAHVLLDAKESGSGQPFDWSLLTPMPLQKPWFLAGGLTVGNVGVALARTAAPMVDVSSGIEDAPGKKSLEKIAAFNRAVLKAAHD